MAVAILVALGSAAGLSWAFTEQLALSQKLRLEEARLERAVEAALERQQALLELEEYVLTDEFVEDWARESLRMVREGETTFVLVDPGPAVSPAPAAAVEEFELVQKPVWLQLWELLIGR
jgi:cell division protein FtsB